MDWRTRERGIHERATTPTRRGWYRGRAAGWGSLRCRGGLLRIAVLLQLSIGVLSEHAAKKEHADIFIFELLDKDGYWRNSGPSVQMGVGLTPLPEGGAGISGSRAQYLLESVATGYFLTDAAANKSAKCLDGTPSLYYHRPGFDSGTQKWFVFMQGGGWCNTANASDELVARGYDNCQQRSRGALGSTRADREVMLLRGGYFDSDPVINPAFHNWNLVFMRYCDGASWGGLRTDPVQMDGTTLHYRGDAILDATIEDLLTSRGLRVRPVVSCARVLPTSNLKGVVKAEKENATEVVISGCSAGGLATILHTNRWRNRILAASQQNASEVSVVGMPDSGFFIEYDELDALFVTGLKAMFDEFNMSATANTACMAAHQGEEYKCILAANVMPYISTPMFALQSQYDSWQAVNIRNDLYPPVLNRFGAQLQRMVKESMLDPWPRNAVFLDSCFHHCGGWGTLRDDDGRTQAAAFAEWYGAILVGGNATTQLYGKLASYPCIECCGAGNKSKDPWLIIILVASAALLCVVPCSHHLCPAVCNGSRMVGALSGATCVWPRKMRPADKGPLHSKLRDQDALARWETFV